MIERKLLEGKEKELIDLFRKMDRETRTIFLSHGRFALVAEAAVKHSMSGEKAVVPTNSTKRNY